MKRLFIIIPLLFASLFLMEKDGFASGPLEVVEPFFGTFEGEATASDGQGEAGARKLKVSIEEVKKKSFRLEWQTIILKPDGREKNTTYSVEFRSSKRDGIFGSAMRKNMFGKWEPLNPLKGDPYLWAKVEGDTFIVYGLIIAEDGGYEMQQYDRKMIDENTMELTFHRIKNGKPLKRIKGLLKRAD